MKAAPLLAILLCALAANTGFLLRAAHARELQPEAPLPVPPIPPSQPPPMTAPMPDVDAPVPYAEAWRSPVTLYTGLNHRELPSSGVRFRAGRAVSDRQRPAFAELAGNYAAASIPLMFSC